jgi:hypothetical protein
MTEDPISFDYATFHAAQRKRLCNKRAMPAFDGAWARALTAQLQRLLPDRQLVEGEVNEVVEAFAQTPDAELEKLFHALAESVRGAKPTTEADLIWVLELTSYAAIRCLDLSFWQSQPRWRDKQPGRHGAVDFVATRSALIAGFGLAALNGLFIRPTADARLPGVIDLSDLKNDTNLPQSILNRLYDDLIGHGGEPRVEPSMPLDDDQRAALVAEFRRRRLDQEACVVFIKFPELDSDMRTAVATEVARQIGAHMGVGSADHEPSLVRMEATGISAPELMVQVRKVLTQLPSYMGKAATAASHKPPLASAQPSAPADRSYSWDVFVSHASSDKQTLVAPLVAGMRAVGLRVWFDADELTLGDDLQKALGQALNHSRFGIVVLSPAFVNKGWPVNELNALLSHELANGAKRVLPVLFGLSHTEASAHLPFLGQKLAVDAGQGQPEDIQRVVRAVMRAVDAAA